MKLDDTVNIKLSDGTFHKSHVIHIIPQRRFTENASDPYTILPSLIQVFCNEYQGIYERYESQLEFNSENGEYYEIEFPITLPRSFKCSLL